jgi:hypothetical protein
LRNAERLENGEWSYSTPRVFEEFQQEFPDILGTYQQLAQKVYKCVNMFLQTGSVLCKKGSGRLTKRTAENIEEVEQRIAETPNKSIWRLTQETNLSFDTVQLILKKRFALFFLSCVCGGEIKPLDNKNPHNITSRNIDRQVTHNSHLYENQDFNVLKITNLTFKTDI